MNPMIKLLSPLGRRYALDFLGERDAEARQEALLKRKLASMSRTSIGKELGVQGARLRSLPLTSYGFYSRYYEHPSEGDFIYPLSHYVLAHTSGTMGRPKKYLLPKEAIDDNMRKTGFAIIIIASHDGERFTFEFGDVVYANLSGGSHLTSHSVSIGTKFASRFVKQCPDPELPFRAKVDYFVKNYRDIDYAQMTVTTLLDDAYPRIGEAFHLKGYITQDSSAGPLKEEIRKVTGNYPRVIYGSTESLASALPSIEYPGCFFFDWRICYNEFITEGETVSTDEPRIDEPPETVSLMGVEPGKRYQVVVTPFKTDLVRYVLPDILENVDDGDDVLGCDSPVFRYHARADRLVVLHNFTRIAENEMLHVMDEAHIPYVDFVARRETEGTKDYMTLYLELSEQVPEETVYRRVHETLMEYDRDWRDLSNFLIYEPLRLRLLPRGSFERYLERKGGMPKVDRVEMRDELLKLLVE
ncbi:GH3 auxin-responsive promoter family protein [Candidatus Bathyarchaeota archaeon]|nr:GH3 auxin-responsive promoter family protein [Candidatus Bathyarchaeota archaeon]